MSDGTPDLLARTAELIDIPSVSHDEAAITDHLAAIFDKLDGFSVDRVGANLVARTNLGKAQRLVLAGHTDTVPVNDNATARLDGDTLYGLGSSDMKSGLAVFVELAEAIGRGDVTPTCDLTFVFYACEEVAREHNGLLELFGSRPDLTECDAAILGEPTDAWIEAGCQGAFSVELSFAGARAHSARPWTGVNAIHRAAVAIDRVRAWSGRQPVIDGCEYREAMQVVLVSGGVARNVVPDRCVVTVNHRFAPDHSLDDARAAVRDVVGDAFDESTGDTWTEIDVSAAAPPSLGHPLLASLVERSGRPPRAKLGWTDVAFFAEQAIPAANFGPGDPLLAHTQGEFVTKAQLDAAWQTIVGVVTS
ncbi:MAG: succinyl-diaminopimelate desuccinylase [Actinomycetota bacterium]|jgi:succinyl-diaminopimelate desuccinylase